MTATSLGSDPLVAAYDELLPILTVDGLPGFEELRAGAIRRYRESGIPTTRDEEFKYTPLHALTETKYRFGYGANLTREDVGGLLLGDVDAITVVFVNGQFAPDLSSTDSLPNGAYIGSFSEATGFEDDIKAHLGSIAHFDGRLGSTNDLRFVDLNTAYLGDGTLVFLEKNVAVERAIHIVHVVSASEVAALSFPRNLIVLGENAEAKVLESYVTFAGNGVTIPVTEVRLAASARLEHNRLQNESLASTHIANIFVDQATTSVYTSNNINFGASVSRCDINAYVGGEHCETWLNSANVAAGSQIIDNHTRIDHAVPNCQSFEVYKSILKDNGVGVFNGKIFVYEDAQKTDAKQTNQAILLSPTATMNTKPQLEIFADDVKCTHGATIGQLREDALFYLRARGIPLAEAQGLLVYAFAAEVLEKITIDEVREKLEAALFEKLGS